LRQQERDLAVKSMRQGEVGQVGGNWKDDHQLLSDILAAIWKGLPEKALTSPRQHLRRSALCQSYRSQTSGPAARDEPHFWSGTGIFLSRLTGLIRERIFAHYFGNSAAADAFKAAFRIPNFLQNLFGEGVLSASFVPVYVGQLTRQSKEEAGKLAGAIGAILALCTSVLVLLGIYATPYLIDVIAPGFTGSKRELAVNLVRIFFPGAGLLVLSAWCLGVLSSHRRFLVSYTAPVIWNLVIIVTLLSSGEECRSSLWQRL